VCSHRRCARAWLAEVRDRRVRGHQTTELLGARSPNYDAARREVTGLRAHEHRAQRQLFLVFCGLQEPGGGELLGRR